jgi:DNA-binding phage protein
MEHTPLRRTEVAKALRGEIARQKAARATLAQAAGLTVEQLRRRLRGDRPFNVDEFVALCHALNVPVSEMLAKAGIE